MFTIKQKIRISLSMHGVFISLCNMSNNLDEMENITHPTENNNFFGVAFDIYHVK